MPEKEPDYFVSALKLPQENEAAIKRLQEAQAIWAKFGISEADQQRIHDSAANVMNYSEWTRSMDAAHGLATAGALRASNFHRNAYPLSLTPSQENLEKEISALKKEQKQTLQTLVQTVDVHAMALKEKDQNIAEQEKQKKELGKALADALAESKILEEKMSLQFLLTRVHPDAHQKLLSSAEFRQEFLQSQECYSYVMSIDIRRSTELMLKATSPQKFADFITDLCGKLSEIVIRNYGVYDKFTGDGILAFFPEFFSGKDAGYYALRSAVECHNAFKERYDSSRHVFNSVIKDIGLGIGIDFGIVKLVQMAGGLTVVGSPVVYACRFGSAPAGTTLLNHPAYKSIHDKYGAHIHVDETEIPIKHEGVNVAYKVKFGSSPYSPKSPDWLTERDDVATTPTATPNP